jgi:hypothetical protein
MSFDEYKKMKEANGETISDTLKGLYDNNS